MPASTIKPEDKRFILRLWAPVVIWMGAIFVFSSLPSRNIPSLFPLQDVFFHGIIYAGLAWVFMRAAKNTFLGLSPLKLIFLTVIFCTVYGLCDEFHQSFVPGRDASLFDVAIDLLGAFMGSLFYR
ncbi:MAG: VanZ family protein [Deltaproteobacteria bacterium]